MDQIFNMAVTSNMHLRNLLCFTLNTTLIVSDEYLLHVKFR